MMGKAYGQVAGVLKAYDFSGFRSIVDVGGGRGHLLSAVLGAAPNTRGVLFDLPHVTASAQAAGIESERLRMHPAVSSRMLCRGRLLPHHAGNPRLERRKAAQHPRSHTESGAARSEAVSDRVCCSGRLEAKLDEDLDLQMLTLLSGKERTEKEYRELLQSAGFRLDRLIDVGMSTSILESVAV